MTKRITAIFGIIIGLVSLGIIVFALITGGGN